MMMYILIIILIVSISVVAWRYKLADLLVNKFVESIKKREPVSTGIDDVFSHFRSIEDYSPQPASDEVMNELAQNGKVTLGPGVYDFYLQSFCLDAGRHGPSSDSAYLIAPLKGKRSSIVRNILENSVRDSDIPQHKIQTLIWAISSDIKYGEMPRNLQLISDQLLAEDDLRSLGKSFLDKIPKPILDRLLTELKKKLPREILYILDAADNIKWKIADARTTYEELERVAIRLGKAPIPEDMQKIEVGEWSLVHGSGQFFIRVSPEGYSCSMVQIYVPEQKYWAELADRMAKKYDVDPRVLKAVIEAETSGKNIKGDYSKKDGRYHAFGYGQVWPKWHYEKIWEVMRDVGLKIPEGKEKDFQYLGQQLIQNNEVSMAVAALVIKDFWKQSGDINDFSDEHFRDFTRKYVGQNIPENDLGRRLSIWEKWKNNLSAEKQMNFNPSNYIAIPVNPNEQRLGFRGIKCGW